MAGRSAGWEIGQATLWAGVTLLVSGISLAATTPDDAPWIGSWLDGVFEAQRSLGWILIGLGIACAVVSALTGEGPPQSGHSAFADVPDEERNRAIAQRLFNPPHPPKPDWGQTLRGLGLFASLAGAGWYLAGAPAIGEYRLEWLRVGFDAYGTGIVIIAVTMITWSVLTMAYAPQHPLIRGLLEVPLDAGWWLLRHGALVIGALVLAVVSGLGVSAFGP